MKLMVMSSYLLDLVRSFEPVPDANGPDLRTSGLRKIVDDWINPATRSNIESTYGPIANWNTEGITSMRSLFMGKRTFNSDISKWNVSNVYNMDYSTFSIHLVSFSTITSTSLSSQNLPHFFFFLFLLKY